MTNPKTLDSIRHLLTRQPLGVLATQRAGRAHTSLVAFVASEDLKSVVFATGRATRKFRNCSQTEEVALLVDDRSNDPEDFHRAAAVSVYGQACEVPQTDAEPLRRSLIERHPYLAEFVATPTCALMRIRDQPFFPGDPLPGSH